MYIDLSQTLLSASASLAEGFQQCHVHRQFTDSFTKIHTFPFLSRLCLLPHRQFVYRIFRYIFSSTSCPVLSIFGTSISDRRKFFGWEYISTMHRANKQPESRAASSNNWRLPAKPEETHREKPSNEQKNRPAIEPDSESVPAAIAEGRRLYVGNLLYIARIEDVESLFPADEYKV